MSVTWKNAGLRAYVAKLPRAGDSTSQKVADYLKERVSENVTRVGAVRTGELRDSPTVTRSPDGGRRVVVRAAHGVPVNYGTIHMAARPFWEPALQEAATQFPIIAMGEFKP